MLTPLDIQNKEFTKGFRGYIEIEVDSFLDEVITDFEHIFKENLELKSKIDMLNEQIKHYGSMENTLQKTLIVAQTTAEDVIKSARQQGDAIINESDRRAEKIMESARDQVINSKTEYERIRKEILMFKTKYKSLLTSQLENIDHYSEDDNVFSILEEMKENDSVKHESVFQSEKVEKTQMEETPVEDTFTQDFKEPKFEDSKDQYVASFSSDEQMYSQEMQEPEIEMEPILGYQDEDIYDNQMVSNYQGQDDPFAQSIKSSQDEQAASYQGENMYADSLQSKENEFTQSFGNDSPTTYQGQNDMYSQNEEAPGNAFASKLQRQKEQRDQESLYVENLQQEQKVNKNKITPKEMAYDEEIQNIYTSMEPKNAVLD